MKNFLLLLLFIFGSLLFAGFFTVNEQENAVVASNIHLPSYYSKPGLYFAYPFMDKVSIIYTGERKVFLNLVPEPESFSNNESTVVPQKSINELHLGVLVDWHVNDSQLYLKNIEKNGQITLDKSLAKDIYNIVKQKIMSLDLKTLNNAIDILSDKIIIPELGISIDKINIISVEKISRSSAAENIESAVPKNSSTAEEYSFNPQDKMIESAYYQAHKIKTQTELDEAKAYSGIRHENSKFYDYFRLIEVYKNSAKSKEEVPPFSKLYFR